MQRTTSHTSVAELASQGAKEAFCCSKKDQGLPSTGQPLPRRAVQLLEAHHSAPTYSRVRQLMGKKPTQPWTYWPRNKPRSGAGKWQGSSYYGQWEDSYKHRDQLGADGFPTYGDSSASVARKQAPLEANGAAQAPHVA